MPVSVSCGVPAGWTTPTMTAQTPFRQYDIGTKVYQRRDGGGEPVPVRRLPRQRRDGGHRPRRHERLGVSAGYCCVANSSSALQGGYIFGLMNSAALTVAAADVASPRIDLVCATVSDNWHPSSTSLVQIITGVAAGHPGCPFAPGEQHCRWRRSRSPRR